MSETIDILSRVIADRRAHPHEDSYTCRLLDQGDKRILKKVGEEAAEVIVAASLENNERLVSETADLIYHLLVMLEAHDLSWSDVEKELARRFS